MHRIATWIRECDQKWFAEAFAPFPEVQLVDARLEPVDLETVGGLLLTGGEDISSEWLRQPVPDPSLIEGTDPVRDKWEFPALERALERKLPILAICRGHQILNVGLGGTLLLHIPNHAEPEEKYENTQALRYEPTAVSPVFRAEKVNSSHHQAIDALAPGLSVEARCADDDIIEQVRGTQTPFVVGVQYHPERHALYRPLFAAFVDAVKALKGGDK